MKNLRWLTLVSFVILTINSIQASTPGNSCSSNNNSVSNSNGDKNNALPSTQNDTITLVANYTAKVTVLANDSGLEDGGLVLKTVYNPVFGNAVINPDNTITYIPEKDYSGIDMISYEVCDMNNDCSVAYIIITVNGLNSISISTEKTTGVDSPNIDVTIN